MPTSRGQLETPPGRHPRRQPIPSGIALREQPHGPELRKPEPDQGRALCLRRVPALPGKATPRQVARPRPAQAIQGGGNQPDARRARHAPGPWKGVLGRLPDENRARRVRVPTDAKPRGRVDGGGMNRLHVPPFFELYITINFKLK